MRRMPIKDPEKRKAYHRRYMREVWYPRNREKHQRMVAKAKAERREKIRQLLESKRTACMLCGEDHPAALDFHHRDPSQKSFSIGLAVGNNLYLSSLSEEIDKCDVLCSNCHRKLHWTENNGP